MRRTLALVLAVSLLAAAGCSGSDAPDALSGPLCTELPKGDEPGNPTALANAPASEALSWITVLTTFDGALRAADLLPELEGKQAITVLAPSDDAFAAKFSQDNLDELMIKDKDTLRTLLRAHIVDKALSVSDLRDADSVKTLDGTTVRVSKVDEGMAQLGDEARTVCADYRIANGRVHVINHVLGNLPTTAGQGDSGH
ncbi:fasciclin domain-containing protein [Asanoa sp. NPDC050611]|uniref:fasciclin domain-containing protein n=1 Tax=Asanoa sp. NPDC050611 TaxID=3157098 RepID=UPI0033E463A8